MFSCAHGTRVSGAAAAKHKQLVLESAGGAKAPGVASTPDAAGVDEAGGSGVVGMAGATDTRVGRLIRSDQVAQTARQTQAVS